MIDQWYSYTIERNGRSQPVYRRMSARQAAAIGAKLEPDFDPARRAAGVMAKAIVCDSTPDGLLERSYPIQAEAPAGRLGQAERG